MTPTTTGTVILTLLDDDEHEDPRTQTVAYGPAGMPAWLGPVHARPAGADRLPPGESVRLHPDQPILELAELASIGHPLTTRDTRRLGKSVIELAARLDGVLRAQLELEHLAADADGRLTIAQGVCLRLMARSRPATQTIDAALDRAARRITGRSSQETARYLDWQTSAFPSDDDTIVKDPPLDPDQIAAAIRTRRQIGLETDPLVALADLGRNLVGLEREAEMIRVAGGMVPYQLTVAIDTAQRALARAVTP